MSIALIEYYRKRKVRNYFNHEDLLLYWFKFNGITFSKTMDFLVFVSCDSEFIATTKMVPGTKYNLLLENAL